MPWNTHPTMAVTGSQCMASCVLTPGTVADGMYPKIERGPVTITLEHPTGKMDVIIDFERKGGAFIHKSAGLVRTCRKLAQGHVFIPQSIWKGAQ
jgi:2-methylaconitate cis-trans-isomerase PrpF